MSPQLIFGVKTLGDSNSQNAFVKEFNVFFSMDGTTWVPIKQVWHAQHNKLESVLLFPCAGQSSL